MLIKAATVATANAAPAVVLILNLIMLRNRLGLRLILFHQLGNVFTHNVKFEIDRRTHFQGMEIGVFVCVGNDRYLK